MSPQQALAARLGGEVRSENVIAVGDYRINTYPSGSVFLGRAHGVGGALLGSWRDDTESLAREFEAAVGEVCS